MTFETATFNPNEFELRNYTSPYVTPEQSSDIALVESRVNGQLDFLAQMLGWNGPNYWTNLPETPDQKRQLLNGSFGVYYGFVIPRILEIRNWDDTIVIDKLPYLGEGNPLNVEKVILGFDEYRIQSLTREGETIIISLGPLPQSFYDQIAANEQLKFIVPSLKPAPFYRPEVGISGDASFLVGATGSTLTLFPSYDTQSQFPYKSISLFADSVYYFNQPVYVKFNLTSLTPDIYPSYDSGVSKWYIKIPPSLVTTSAPITFYLCWDYSDSVTPTTVSTLATVQRWSDCSDWGDIETARYFTGAWGNKGGPLPYNLAFDSLSIHGVSEENAVFFPTVSRSLNFNTLVEKVYSQLTPHDVTPPGNPNNGDLWWNPNTGVLSVWYAPYNEGCASWVEIDYRQEPSSSIVATLVYPDVSSFSIAAPTIPDNTTILILDCAGLTTGANIIGLSGPIASSPSLYLYKEIGSPYWTPLQFSFLTVTEFETAASVLPMGVPCIIADAIGLVPVASTYKVSNLNFEVLQPVPAVVTQFYQPGNWEVSPDSLLRYISNTSLNGYENQGEMWWDYNNPVYSTRAASIYIQNAWVSVNSQSLSGPPAYNLDCTSVIFYADGTFLRYGLDYSNGDYAIRYVYDNATQDFVFTYTPITVKGKTQLPVITISDSLEGTYMEDVTDLVFGGAIHSLTPSIADAETPLRLWKTQDLQGVGKVSHLSEDNYVNPLLADINNGPNLVNWERYFIRLPLNYGRNESVWQKVSLICQDFGYWGSSVMAEFMRCPPEENLPVIYEELFIYDQPIQDYTYVYSEPYLYSNIAYFNSVETGDYLNSGFFPATNDGHTHNGYYEGELVSYSPLHDRQANLTLPVGSGYGDWEGMYVNVNPCQQLSGFLTNDLIYGAVDRVDAPIWDASIYKIPPTCEHSPSSYSVDSNHYKIGYAYFVSDASAAEDGFFDVQQEAALRYPENQKSLYILPRTTPSTV